MCEVYACPLWRNSTHSELFSWQEKEKKTRTKQDQQLALAPAVTERIRRLKYKLQLDLSLKNTNMNKVRFHTILTLILSLKYKTRSKHIKIQTEASCLLLLCSETLPSAAPAVRLKRSAAADPTDQLISLITSGCREETFIEVVARESKMGIKGIAKITKVLL